MQRALYSTYLQSSINIWYFNKAWFTNAYSCLFLHNIIILRFTRCALVGAVYAVFTHICTLLGLLIAWIKISFNRHALIHFQFPKIIRIATCAHFIRRTLITIRVTRFTSSRGSLIITTNAFTMSFFSINLPIISNRTGSACFMQMIIHYNGVIICNTIAFVRKYVEFSKIVWVTRSAGIVIRARIACFYA